MKKIVAIMVLVMLMMSLLCGSATAGAAKGKPMADLRVEVNHANRDIRALVRIAQSTPEDDVDWLLGEVDAIVARVQAHAAELGVQVVCSTDSYYIDGRWVEVDPLMVVNIRQ